MTVSSRTNCPGFFCVREKELRKGERENFYFGLGVPRGTVESIGNHFARLAGNFALNAREYETPTFSYQINLNLIFSPPRFERFRRL